jgi:hypothetical protein
MKTMRMFVYVVMAGAALLALAPSALAQKGKILGKACRLRAAVCPSGAATPIPYGRVGT